ncbi:MAG: hypothetical protein DHS20C18_52330 [Saprospiraceae bacterium]|nr:MAG: hypothetical protein DHS20C18_52330 [Saprospiraceae bacterium]
MSLNNAFYKKLKRHAIPLEDLLEDERLFRTIPVDWQIVVADVAQSTQAVKDGLHHQVNLAATGCVIAVQNKLKSLNKESMVPYFFGGDGATFILPDTFLKEIMEVLENYRLHVKKNMRLNLRIGSVSIAAIFKDQRSIKIAKFGVNAFLTVPIVLGNGLKYAERIIKATFDDQNTDSEKFDTPNLEGMECRWDEVAPPRSQEKIICLLVDCSEEEWQSKIYASIVSKINHTFGDFEERQPISIGKLKIDSTVKKIKREMYARIGKYNFAYLIKHWMINNFSSVYFKFFNEGKEYLQKISDLSYTLMIDGTLNSVISGTQEEIDDLILFLDELESQNKIKYGIHTTYASIMSCYVEDRNKKHIHFVDGTEGGFTTAAVMYKAKMA